PSAKLSLDDVKKLRFVEDVLTEKPGETTLLFGPHSLDKTTSFYAEALKTWIIYGGHAIILEQNPTPFSENVLNCGIGFIKANQPHWSRWAANQVKHTDRADIVNPQHPVFAELSEDDMRWWNGDSFLAHCYLSVKTAGKRDTVLSRIGNGLAEDELMPVQYDYIEPGYSIIMMERNIGKGAILVSSMLVGEKSSNDPIAAKLLANLLAFY
ncbi:MAG TPA: hypothetical protein DC049_04885, partial [Spirochaetia bacterium]|nr:hypothetical protein [Spirochaetia bacterium]